MAETTYTQWFKHMEELREVLRELTTEEAMKLSPSKIRASNEMYEALTHLRAGDEGYDNSEIGNQYFRNDARRFIKEALSKADGGK